MRGKWKEKKKEGVRNIEVSKIEEEWMHFIEVDTDFGEMHMQLGLLGKEEKIGIDITFRNLILGLVAMLPFKQLSKC